MEQTNEIGQAVKMLFEAHLERDPMRIEFAMRHLEFIDTLARLSRYEDRQ